MRWLLNNRSGKRWLGQHKLLAWLVFVSLIFGLIEFGAPLDLVLRTMRDKMRSQPVSGEVVVVGIDYKAMGEIGSWPWKRDKLAVLTDRLFEAGAQRVFFELYLEPLDAKGDQILADTFKRYPSRVFVASSMDFSANVSGSRAILPMPQIADKVEAVSVMRWVTHWNGVTDLPYKKMIGGAPRRSMEAAISGVEGAVDEQFPIDYAYLANSIPYVAAGDILRGPLKPGTLTGKSVIVGMNLGGLEGALMVPGQGRYASVFVSAIGAETLKAGKPIDLGWFPLWLLTCGLVLFLLSRKSIGPSVITGSVSLGLVIVGPVFLEEQNIFMDISPALFLLLFAIVASVWQWIGRRNRDQGSTNPISGLRTVNAFLRDERFNPHILVAVRLRRFAEIISTLPSDGEREFLRQVVARLSMGAGEAEMLHGDDGNFFWLLPTEELPSVVDRFKALQLIFRTPIGVGDRRFDADVAFGVDRETHIPPSTRLASALAAAHAAADEGVCWKVHDPASSGEKEWTLSLLGELEEAIDAGDVWVAYQPKMELATGKIIGAEALVRWTHAKRGPIDPGEFIAMAERYGRIDRLTSFVLNDAAQTVTSALLRDPNFKVSVNISTRLLVDRGVVEMVRASLERYNLSASCLILEITETAAMSEGDGAFEVLDELRSLGVGLSIDDYGTGMSTLDYIRRIPAKELKIDRCFTAALLVSAEDQAVMRSTIELAHMLGMRVVAEGIETDESLRLLRTMGCEIGQGYHIGRPMPWIRLCNEIWPPLQLVADG